MCTCIADMCRHLNACECVCVCVRVHVHVFGFVCVHLGVHGCVLCIYEHV